MRVVTFSFFAFVLACGGEVSSGSDGGSTDGATDGGSSSADASILPQSSCVDGAWTGYIENFDFPSNSDAITLTLTSNGATVSGTVTFGAGSPPPTATDPNGVYPPGFQSQGAMTTPSPATYIEGTIFTALGGTFDGSRLQLGIATAEVFKTWCAIQPQTWLQQPNGPPYYECLPNWGFSCNPSTCSSTNPQNASQTITYPAEKLWLCQQVCQCDATTCSAPVTTADVKLDTVCSGTLDGSIAGSLGTHNVHLKKH
jgi:hypothetical protein